MGIYRGELSFETAVAKLLPHQRQFIGSPLRNVAYVGGVGCVAAETVVADVPVAEWLGGEIKGRIASSAFIKGRADLYRVTTRSGKQVVVTSEHRFLAPTGWCPLSRLRVGDVIAADDSERAASVLGTPEDFQEHCCVDSRRRGELLHPARAAFLHKLPPPHSSAFDDSAWVLYDRLSIVNYATRARECASFGCPGVPIADEPLRLWGRLDSLVECSSGTPPTGSGRLSHHMGARVVMDASASSTSSGDSSTCRRFLPCAYVDTFWDEIQDIQFVRHGQFYDLAVPGFEHYSAQGLWHHNSGKTVALCLSAILNGANEPDGFSLIGRLNMPALTNSTMKTFLELIHPEDGDWKPSEKRFIFRNGHEVVFLHLDISDPKVSGHIKSMNLSGAYIDEATEISEDIYFLVQSRLRRKTAPRHLLRLASNPAGHDWVWRHFFDPNRSAKLVKLNLGITATTFDNVHLSGEYVENMLATWPADWQERYIHGHFSDFSDLVYKEFNERTHVWDSGRPHEFFGGSNLPPLTWPTLVGIDIGSDTEHDPWAIVLIAVAPDGSLFQFGEVYGRGLLIAEIADRMWRLMEARPTPDMAYDYSNRQCALELAEHGIHGQPAIKDVQPGLFKTNQYMHVDVRLKHPFNFALEGAPRYFVAAHCVETIKELTSYKWAKDRSGNPTGKPAHENSHSPDAVRYAIHTYRPLPEKMAVVEPWQNPRLDEMSRLYWHDVEKHKREGEKLRPPLRFQRPMRGIFNRPRVIQ